MSVDYEPSQPTTVQQQAQLARAIAAANAKDLRVHPVDPAGARTRTSRATRTARRSSRPTPRSSRRRSRRSRDFIIGNEPNLGLFWFPTFNANGTIASAKTYEAALAASYDALKAVNPSIDVIGIAVSPRGDDRPGSARNTISPVRFIKAVGDAYRASKRTKPIMDNVALHPYPFVNTDPPDKGAPWPKVGVAEPRSRASRRSGTRFNGTAQPTFEEFGLPQVAAAAEPVRWVLDEAGWQTDTRGLAGYTGTENTPTIDEATQASYYKQVIQRYACDNHVAALLFFHWIDEADRDRLQSGLVRANRHDEAGGERRARLDPGRLLGGPVQWKHSIKVDGASSTWKPKNGNLFAVKAFEDATFVATATPTKAALKLAKRQHRS